MSVDGEARSGDPPGVAADDRPKAIILVVRLIIGEAAEAERDVGLASASVGNVDLGDDAAVIDEVHLRAAAIAEHIFEDPLAVPRRTVRLDPEGNGMVL